jgi:hypothetical protein
MIWVVHIGSGSLIRIRIPDSDPDFLPIPDPGFRGQKGKGSRIRISNAGFKCVAFSWAMMRWTCRPSMTGSGRQSVALTTSLRTSSSGETSSVSKTKRYGTGYIKEQCWGSGSGCISQRYGSGSGSFPFLIKVLSRLK